MTLVPAGEPEKPKLVLLDDMTDEEWAKYLSPTTRSKTPGDETPGEQLIDPDKDIIVSGDCTLTPAADEANKQEITNSERALSYRDTIVVGKNGATITWPNGGKANFKPKTKIQVLPEGFRVRMGKTWIKLNYNEKTKGFQALTPNATAGGVRG